MFLYSFPVHWLNKRTPHEEWFGVKLNLCYLCFFGSRVYVKHTVKQRDKLDWHNCTGVFIGYPATMKIIKYLDLHSGIIITCSHATIDEACYWRKLGPPAAQLIYDFWVITESDLKSNAPPNPAVSAQCPPSQASALHSNHHLLRMLITITYETYRWATVDHCPCGQHD